MAQTNRCEDRNVELRDLYDRDRQKLGVTIGREEQPPKDTYWMAVHICIINRENQMLIQQRQTSKKTWPGFWDLSVGGGAIAGDNSRMAAERETMEELGIALNLTGKRPSFTANFYQGFDDVYVVEMDVDLDKLKLQEDEVAAVKWATREEICDMIDGGTFIPYQKCAIDMIFQVREAKSGLLMREEYESFVI